MAAAAVGTEAVMAALSPWLRGASQSVISTRSALTSWQSGSSVALQLLVCVCVRVRMSACVC